MLKRDTPSDALRTPYGLDDPGPVSIASTELRSEQELEREAEERRRRRAEALSELAGETSEFRRPFAPRQEAMILLEDVTKIYSGDVVGLRDVSLQIDKGEWVFLVGPSGSGKSTFIKLLLKEIDATSGNVQVGGRSLRTLKRSQVPKLRRNIGCVFQDFKLLPTRTVYENVAYALEVQGQRREVIERKVPEIIGLVGLADKIDKLPHELSGGQQQRVSIARAFVNHPPLLICDEMVDKMRRRVIALEEGRVARDDRRGGYVEEDAE
jgi:cell division transport system ATP-binding protein